MSTETLEIKNLTLGYGKRVLLQDASCRFGADSLVALLGRNGAGKSTLLRALAGLESPIEGSVLLSARPLADFPPEEIAKKIAFVATSRVRIPDLRCADLVALGRAPYTNWLGSLTRHDRDVVDRSLALVGMSAFAERPLNRMSDGECQRVMIARALAQDTPIILLDEPTSFLDLPNRYELCLLLKKLATEQRKTVIFSTHELDIALALADEIALIDNPRLTLLPTDEMRRSAHIERLFSSENIAFSPVTGKVTFRC